MPLGNNNRQDHEGCCILEIRCWWMDWFWFDSLPFSHITTIPISHALPLNRILTLSPHKKRIPPIKIKPTSILMPLNNNNNTLIKPCLASLVLFVLIYSFDCYFSVYFDDLGDSLFLGAMSFEFWQNLSNLWYLFTTKQENKNKTKMSSCMYACTFTYYLLIPYLLILSSFYFSKRTSCLVFFFSPLAFPFLVKYYMGWDVIPDSISKTHPNK